MESQIFDYVLVVKKESNEEPTVAYRFPRIVEVEEDMVTAIPQFCFPEASGTHSNVSRKRETFSFTLTKSDATKAYGYCRRFLDGDTPVCYCIVSRFPSFSLFSGILDVVEKKHANSSNNLVFVFLKAVLARPFPAAGESIEVKTFSDTDEPDCYSFLRPSDSSVLDYVSYQGLFRMVPVESVVHLFECLLAERRVILAANKLGVVSNCITALTGLLYPLSWQHIFIPVLPNSLLAYCSAPMPFLVGAMKWSLKEILSMPLEEVVILDCDTGDFFKDHECQALPKELRANLEQNLRRLVLSDRQEPIEQKTFNSLVSSCFVRVLSELLGAYKEAIAAASEFTVPHVNGLMLSKSPYHSSLVTVTEESQMWDVFLRCRYDLYKQSGSLDSCCLGQAPADQSPVAHLPLRCSKCAELVPKSCILGKDPPLCDECQAAATAATQDSSSESPKKDRASITQKLKKRTSKFSSRGKLSKTIDRGPSSENSSSGPAPSVFTGQPLDASPTPKRRSSTMGSSVAEARPDISFSFGSRPAQASPQRQATPERTVFSPRRLAATMSSAPTLRRSAGWVKGTIPKP